MFTSMDKALAALVMAALSILNLAFGWHITADPSLVSGIIAALTPVVVYMIPNKPKAPSA